jgi:hypothetical protein
MAIMDVILTCDDLKELSKVGKRIAQDEVVKKFHPACRDFLRHVYVVRQETLKKWAEVVARTAMDEGPS